MKFAISSSSCHTRCGLAIRTSIAATAPTNGAGKSRRCPRRNSAWVRLCALHCARGYRLAARR